MKSGLARLSLHAALFLAAPLIAAGSARAAEHVKLCAVRSFGGGPTMVALDKGFFAAQGSRRGAGDVRFGAADRGRGRFRRLRFRRRRHDGGILQFRRQGTLKIIAAGTWEHAGFQSIGILVSNQAYAAGLKGFKDMAGHTVGITQLGTPLQYYFLQLAAKYHVPEASIRFLPLQSNGVVASAIAGGQADLAVQTAAPISAIVEKGDGKLLGWTADELPPRQGEAVFTATKTANDRPAIVRAYIAGLRAGEAYFHDALIGPDGKLPRGLDRARGDRHHGEISAAAGKRDPQGSAVFRSAIARGARRYRSRSSLGTSRSTC